MARVHVSGTTSKCGYFLRISQIDEVPDIQCICTSLIPAFQRYNHHLVGTLPGYNIVNCNKVMEVAMKLEAVIVSVFLIYSLLSGISLAQNKVVVIPLASDDCDCNIPNGHLSWSGVDGS